MFENNAIIVTGFDQDMIHIYFMMADKTSGKAEINELTYFWKDNYYVNEAGFIVTNGVVEELPF